MIFELAILGLLLIFFAEWETSTMSHDYEAFYLLMIFGLVMLAVSFVLAVIAVYKLIPWNLI